MDGENEIYLLYGLIYTVQAFSITFIHRELPHFSLLLEQQGCSADGPVEYQKKNLDLTNKPKALETRDLALLRQCAQSIVSSYKWSRTQGFCLAKVGVASWWAFSDEARPPDGTHP